MFKQSLPFFNDDHLHAAGESDLSPGLKASHVPLINTAGSLGFAPNPRGPLNLARFSAFVTHPISRHARRPAETRTLLPFPGGFLLHSGFPNPGFRAVLKRFAAAWVAAPLPVVAHLIPENEDEMAWMTGHLEGLDNIAAIELGLRDDSSPHEGLSLIRAGLGELPLIVCLPPGRAAELGPLLAQSGAAAFSLAPPRGYLPGPDDRLVRGRLYGPALLPQALEAVSTLARLGLPVIGSGGVYGPADIQAMRHAGAQAVALDAALWKNFDVPFWGAHQAFP